MNTILTFGTMALALAIGFTVTYPDPPMAPLMALGIGIAVFGPLLFWPVSHTIWTALDIAFRPVTPDELDPSLHEPDEDHAEAR